MQNSLRLHLSRLENFLTLGKSMLQAVLLGTTGKVQPLDVYDFRIWKNYVRHFLDSVILLD